jgi:hypothetical protein
VTLHSGIVLILQESFLFLYHVRLVPVCSTDVVLRYILSSSSYYSFINDMYDTVVLFTKQDHRLYCMRALVLEQRYALLI